MFDNVAKHAIIGRVDGRLRFVRHSIFMSSTAERGNHKQVNEQQVIIATTVPKNKYLIFSAVSRAHRAEASQTLGGHGKKCRY
ncbi:hypothetical protein [Pantoea sp.]|uniref:hypothetical protein n=1 Tax=Pantoea sp. TaxID=69393 RepID=UPI0031DC5365